jgi:hypothetical protein
MGIGKGNVIVLQADGERLYIVGSVYPLRDRIKAVGGHWDDERKSWYVGRDKTADITELIVQSQGGRP